MKNVLSLLVFISILSAQQSAPDTSWTKIIGDANYDVANSIIEINDGYVLAGQSWVAETNSTDAVVVKMNFDGDTLWSNSFNGMLQGQSEDIAHDIKQTEDNGFIIVGYKSANNENLNSGYRDIWVIKLDSNGDTLWTKSYGVQYNYYSGYSIQQTFDDGFIISGQCGNQPCLLKIDSLGLREWIRSYQIGGISILSSVKEVSNGNFISIGTNTFNEDKKSLAILTDSLGFQYWASTYSNQGQGGSGSSIVETHNESFVYTGSIGYDAGIKMTKINNQGEELWSRTFENLGEGKGLSIVNTSDGGFAITGFANSLTADARGLFLIKTNYNGNLEWSKLLIEQGIEQYGKSLKQSYDDGYIVCGLKSNQTGTNIWVLKFHGPSPLTINEIMNNPASVNDNDGEWFELYNKSDRIINLGGLTIKDLGTDIFTIPNFNIYLEPGGYYLLAVNNDSSINGGISEVDLVYNRNDFILGNSDDEIIVIDSYGIELARVEYDGGINFPDLNGKSMELNYYTDDTNTGSNWVESENLLPSGDYGTPGYVNSTLQPEINITSIYVNQEYLLVNSGSFDPPELGDCIVTNFPEYTTGPCDTAYFYVEVSNSGTADLIINDYSFTNDLFPLEGNRWIVNDSLPIIIPQDSYHTIIVQFIPWRFTDFEYWYGIRSNTLILNTNDAENDSISIDLSIPVILDGRGYVLEGIDWNLGQDMFDLPNVDFGDVVVGVSVDTTIKLTSYGNEELEVDGASSANMPFSLISDDGGLALYEFIDIEINFSPQTSGDFSDTISIESNAQMYYPTFIVDLPGPQMIPPQPKFIIKGSGTVLSIDDEIVPEVSALHQNYPNPFNPITSLRYDLPEDGLVNITIYDVMGRIVKTLVNGSQTAGFKSVQWNATNDRNEPVSAGLYLYTIQAGEFRQTKKMVLLK